jgi:hypothetical protein
VELSTSHVERLQSQNPHVYRRYTRGSVSGALWPADMRRSLATGRFAQGRRLLLLSCRRSRLLAAISQFGTRLLRIVISMAIGATIVAALLLRSWYVFLPPILLLTLLSLIIAPPVVMKLVRALQPPGRQPIPPLRPLRNLPLFPGAHGEPETPLPEAPLVRVLETYDLSTNNVQHDVALGLERDTAELRLNLGRRLTLEDDEEIVTDTQLL